VVEHLPCKYEVLSSNPNTVKKIEKIVKMERQATNQEKTLASHITTKD
jgi:hypothetical protein